ncbi:MAG TPA: hypothetical protein VGT07_16310 [Steroidobacteraceae bacterium]|nr:hypothetical protein [Steroidobacteraceae bacterium]
MSEPNSNLISRIQSSTKARLIGWQFAADGQWDVAERTFFEHTTRQALSRVEHWLAMQTTGNIAFEALFESEGNERFFLGVRITHLTTQEKAEVTKRMIAMSSKGDGIDTIVQTIRSVLGDQRLADADPDYLELGVFDLWNRVKSVVVWRKGEVLGQKSELVMPEELADKAQTPDAGFAPLHEPQTRPLILEAAWTRKPDIGNSYQCWIGLPVSDGGVNTGEYCLSESRYLSAVSTFIDRSPAGIFP